MKSTDTLVPLRDILDLLQRIECSEEKTITQLLNRVELDLKSVNKPVENLKALNYFMLHASNHGSTLYIYETVLKSCLNFFIFLEDKHKMHHILLGTIIDSSFSCISADKMFHLFSYILNFILSKLEAFSNSSISLENTSLHHALFILEKLCSQVIAFPEYELSTLFPGTLTKLIISLIFEIPLDVSKSILGTVLPVFISAQNSNTCLKLIWEKVDLLFKRDGLLEKHLYYLCLLSDNYIVLSPSSVAFPIHDKSSFWEVLQKGLINDSSLCRKQSLYLLKRYISVLEKNNIQFENDLFFWYPERKSQVLLFWSHIFVLLEVLEEKQTHLVMPAIKNFHEIYSLCEINEKICYSWLFCVFFRVICHSSTSVVKWGLREFCLIRVDLLFIDRKCNLLLSSFFKSMNNMFLYNAKDHSSEEFTLEENLVKWFISISENNLGSPCFFEIGLENLVNSAWSPIPLFFVINSLSQVPKSHQWGANCFSFIKKILLETLKTQCIFIRSAIQCQLLKCITQLSKEDVEISTVINILGQFNAQESLCRGSGMWNNCVNWLRSFGSHYGSELVDLCTDRIFSLEVSIISIHSFARGIVMFIDAGILTKNEKLSNLLISINEQFIDCEKRIYSCPKKQDRGAEFLKCIINELNLSLEESVQNDIVNLAKPCINNLFLYIGLKLKRGLLGSIKDIELCEAVLVSVLSNLSLFPLAHSECIYVYNLSFNMLRTANLPFFQEFLSLRIIFNCYNYFIISNLSKDKFVLPFNEDIIELIFVKRLLNKDTIQVKLNDGSEHNLKGKLMSQMMNTLWSILDIYLRFNSAFIKPLLDRLPIPVLINCALSAICEDGKEALVPILKSFVILLPFNVNMDIGIQFITRSWEACFELRKSELFWLGITEWIAMVYQEKIVTMKEYHEVLFSLAKNIMELGNELVGLVDILMDQLNTFNIPSEFSFIISEGLTFGGITKKDKRMEYDVCQYIMKKVREGSMESFGNWKHLKNDKEVRLKAMNLLLKDGDFKQRNSIINCVVKDLLAYDEELSKNTKRYFNDSVTHRRKHRILQALLILANYIYMNSSEQFKELPEKIFGWVFESLQGSNQQPSVRYQLEWLFILLSVHYPHFLDNFWTLFDKAGEDRIGSMCSFICISYHLAVILKDDIFLEKCIENIIPLCMSQNFNIRLYAQVTLRKLWDLNSTITNHYNFIRMNQWKTCEQGNMLTNAKKMQSDFYFSAFHPIHHFTIQTIYWDLPRLANISSEEWIHPDILKKYSHFLNDFQISEIVPSLEAYSSPTWVSRNSGEAEEESDTNSIQKKFIPWKGMFPDSENKTKGNKIGIIVVASLIDKPANLGGLARTCEIFAAKELVIPSLEITKDKEFIGLSMTAEKHLFITEVRPYNLQEYLKIMKSMGHMLIGAEQTTGSVSLMSYKFPQDCVLLLGSEREGIPANLIPLLDVCVEIPQLGVIRSLNVHVSGALLLWEYSKQHSLQAS